jgi:hypothetical protein
MGHLHEGGPDLWIDDIQQAARELADISGNPRLNVFGMRLGASLAYLACNQMLATKTLILWEPVVSGTEYILQLQRRDRFKNLKFLRPPRSRTRHEELFGYTWPKRLNESIQSINLLAEPPPPVQQMAVITSWPQSDFQSLCSNVTARGIKATVLVADANADRSFDQAAMRETIVLSNDILMALSQTLRQEGDRTIFSPTHENVAPESNGDGSPAGTTFL